MLELEKIQSDLESAGIATDEAKAVLSDFEKEQVKKGWNPEGPKSAEEWANTEPLYEELKKRGKQLKSMQRTIEELKEHMQKQDQIAYEKALRDIEAQRKEAIRNGDVDLVEHLDEQKQQMNVPQQQPQQPEQHPAIKEFAERHASWLNDVSYEAIQMQQWLLERDKLLASKNLPPEKHVEVIEDHLKKQFPNYFCDNIKESVDTVDTITSDMNSHVASPAHKNKKYTFSHLNDTQKRVARDFERMKIMSVDEYIKQLVNTGELK